MAKDKHLAKAISEYHIEKVEYKYCSRTTGMRYWKKKFNRAVRAYSKMLCNEKD
jgi:hypothetical protein